ncbi:hypothetical protein Tco_1548593 [Tanacetum coccineum]
MADHSQKWHDGSSNRKTRNGSLDGISAIINKLDSLGRDIKKLKENEKAAKEVPNTSAPIGHFEEIFADHDVHSVGTCSNDTNKVRRVSFISNCDVQVTKKKKEGSS